MDENILHEYLAADGSPAGVEAEIIGHEEQDLSKKINEGYKENITRAKKL